MDFIRAFIDAYGYPPTTRQVAAAVGLSSSSGAAYQLRILADLGLLRRDPKTSRGVTLAPTPAAIPEPSPPLPEGACPHCGCTCATTADTPAQATEEISC